MISLLLAVALPIVNPPRAYSVAAAYDSTRGRLMVFGGYANRGYSGDTWVLEGTAWRRLEGAGPSPRNAPFMVFDTRRQRMVLFGGDRRDSGPLGDTWEHDGTSWRQVDSAGPAPRTTHAMAYDARRGRVVMFGGVGNAATGETLGDTWEWDGTRWHRGPDGPRARALHGLAYDAARGRIVLFGGTARAQPDAEQFSDTWEYDGRRWTQITTRTGPSARDHIAMGFDAARGAVLLQGGGTPEARRETWALRGGAWTLLTDSGPPRAFARLAYDSRAGRMMLFGGFDREPSNETWWLDGAAWRPVEVAVQGSGAGHALVANQQSESASLIDLRTDSTWTIGVGTGPHEAQISPSGAVGLVTVYGQGAPGNELAVIDIRQRRLTRHISLGDYSRPHGVIFLDDNRAVVTSEASARLVLVDIAAGRVDAAIETGAAGSHMVAVTRDGRRAFTANVGSGSVSEIDLEHRRLVRTIATGPRTEGIAVTPDGSIVLAGSNTNGTVSFIETATGTITTTLSGFSLPYRLAVSADGRTAIVCDPQGGAMHVIDIASRTVAWRLDGLGSPRGVTISADGRTAFVTLNGESALGVVDMGTRRIVKRYAVGYSPDGVGWGR